MISGDFQAVIKWSACNMEVSLRIGALCKEIFDCTVQAVRKHKAA